MNQILCMNHVKSLYWTVRNEGPYNCIRKIFRLYHYRIGVLIYPQVNFKNKGGSLKVNQRLVLGKTHDLSSYQISDIKMFPNSFLVVGDFKIYTGFNIAINKGARLRIGSGYANNNLKIDCFNEINIGENVAISHNVIIRDSDNHKISGQTTDNAPIMIGNHVWVGMNAIILKGVNIRDGAVIAAGAVVTHDVPERCLVAGVPARIIRQDVDWQ